MGMPAGSPVRVATRHSPWDSPAVSNRNIKVNFYRDRKARVRATMHQIRAFGLHIRGLEAKIRLSGGFGPEFMGLMTGEIGVRGLVEAAVAIDVGVEMVVRKNEAIFGRIVR